MNPHDKYLIAIIRTRKTYHQEDHHRDDHDLHDLKEKAKDFIQTHMDTKDGSSTRVRAEFEYGKEGKNPPFNAYDPWLNQDGYKEYIDKHGHHFSRKLSIWASNRMENDDGSDHHKSPELVKAIWSKHGYKLPEDATWGDATYAYNMAYADYHPEPLETEEDVACQSYKDVNDKDGYSGKIFNRWLSDIVYKNISVPWEEML